MVEVVASLPEALITEDHCPAATEFDVGGLRDLLAPVEGDEIDELVNAQLRRTPSGYDYSINQPTCARCGEDRHPLPITQRMQEIRALWWSTVYRSERRQASPEAIAVLEAYRYDLDDSPIVCPGDYGQKVK